MDKYWECGLCHIITMGDWDCEVKPHGEDDEAFKPVCKLCEIGVKENFVPENEGI